MSENMKKLNLTELKTALSDDDLNKVVGGISEVIYLYEGRLPLDWYVTCCRCGSGFQVGEGRCPSCGGVEVWLARN